MAKKTILVADDDEALLESVVAVLMSEGHTVFGYSNADEVIEEIKEKDPDVVLLDVWMPGISGDRLACQLKDDGETKKVRVYLMSAGADTRKRAEACGADGYLSKPFEIDDLLALGH